MFFWVCLVLLFGLSTFFHDELSLIPPFTAYDSVYTYTAAFPWDVTGDDYVGIDDIVSVAEHFGQTP